MIPATGSPSSRQEVRKLGLTETRPHKVSVLLRNRLHRLGIDRAIAWVIVGRSWGIIAGPITIFLIGTRLTAQEQGYYYTFANLLSMAMFFELGLGGWITRFASYEMAKLHWSDTGCLTGDGVAHQRLSSLFRFAVRWYLGAALALFVGVFPVGVFFFHTQPGSEEISWLIPWLFVVLISSCNMALSSFFSFLEGCGLVAQMVGLVFARNFAGNLFFWGSLLIGLGLLSSPVLSAVGVLLSCAYLIMKRPVFTDLWRSTTPTPPGFAWKHELLPLQWRTAITNVFGYFAWQTANPILFKLAGPVEAGKLGMGLNLATMLQAFGMAWVNTKVPRMGALLGQDNKAGLDHLFRVSTIQAMSVVSFGSVVLLVAVITLQTLHHPLAARLLSPGDLAILLMCNWIGTLQYAFMVYVRTNKQEPFVTQMIVLGVAMPVICYLTGMTWSTTGMLVGMTCVNTVFGLLWTSAIFRSVHNK